MSSINTGAARHAAMPVRVTSLVPTHDKDGHRLLCWRVLDELLVHPDNWDLFVAAVVASDWHARSVGP